MGICLLRSLITPITVITLITPITFTPIRLSTVITLHPLWSLYTHYNIHYSIIHAPITIITPIIPALQWLHTMTSSLSVHAQSTIVILWLTSIRTLLTPLTCYATLTLMFFFSMLCLAPLPPFVVAGAARSSSTYLRFCSPLLLTSFYCQFMFRLSLVVP